MKYWAYINNEIKGPFEADELIKIEGFSPQTLVCPQSPVEEDTKEWKEAREIADIALLISSNLPSEGDKKTEAEELSKTEKKEDVIIERFSVENIFTPASDSDISSYMPSTDPLTLSQIRKRMDAISENMTSTDKPHEEQKKPTEISVNQPTELKKESEGLQDEIFEIPSTDELLKEAQSTDIQPQQTMVEGDKTQVEGFKAETKEFSLNASEISEPQEKIHTIKTDDVDKIIDSKIGKIKKSLVDELSTAINEKMSYLEEKFRNQAIVQNQSFDSSKLKDDILNEIEKKISSISSSTAPLSVKIDDSFKKDIDELKTLVSHLEIEIKDLKLKYEGIENKTKAPIAPLVREKIADNKSTTPQESKASVSVAKSEKKKPKVLKVIVGFFVSIAMVFSVLFAVKHLGIFDFTSFLKSKNPQMTIEQPTPSQQAIQEGSNAESVVNDTSSVEATIPIESQKVQQMDHEEDKEQEISLETIINEVKDYRIKSPYNLDTTIKMILKSKKGDLSTLKWDAKLQDDGKYLITVTAKALKPVEFRFEFDHKTKILQPLNTLSANTLKMLMEGSEKGKSIRKNIKKSKVKLKDSKAHLNDQNKESGVIVESITDTKSQPNSSSLEEGEDYLIIGE